MDLLSFLFFKILSEPIGLRFFDIPCILCPSRECSHKTLNKILLCHQQCFTYYALSRIFVHTYSFLKIALRAGRRTLPLRKFQVIDQKFLVIKSMWQVFQMSLYIYTTRIGTISSFYIKAICLMVGTKL